MAGDFAMTVRTVLADAGADTTQARNFDFYLYYPREREARAAARELGEVGFRCSVQPAALGHTWLCRATARLVPSEPALEAVRYLMEVTAEDFGGAFDGWETPLALH
jgi:hypothetical protein